MFTERKIVERIIAFQRTSIRRQAESIVETPIGFASFNSRYCHSHDHNKFVLQRPFTTSWTLAQLDATLRDGGCEHRMVVVHEESLGDEVLPTFAAAGYEHGRSVYMHYSRPQLRASDGVHVEQVTLTELQDVDRSGWRRSLPEASVEVVEQLAMRRTTRLAIATDVAFLGIRGDGGDVIAHADLYIDKPSGVAQVEDVQTRPEHRNKGLARALITHAVKRAEAANCGLIFLEADADDWPQSHYAQLGFSTIAVAHTFSKDVT
ncbi:GNAT family N-acetyltransferase [Catellatospora sp. NPDC049609]|uniref:GNAT family N-acetyltransferase n=1 Tax=Catellatospora sp. NPDC049609 TaxID=3155505 RepID=UPI0034313906